MKKLLLLLPLALLLLPAEARAQSCSIPPGTRLIPMAFEEKTVTTTATTFTPATYQPGTDSNEWARAAYVSVETDSIRWRVVGTPTASSGHPIAAGQSYMFCSLDSVAAFSMIRSGAANAKVTITYFKLR
jgi:hypothetical protein